MNVKITYGDGKIEIDIPEKNLAQVIEPKAIKTISDKQAELNRVLDNSHGPSLKDLSKRDHTRDEPHWDLLTTVIPRLKHASKIVFVITTGSHEVMHPGNLEISEMIDRIAGESKIENYQITINDCHSSEVVDLGKTSRGTPVIITSVAVGHDLYVSLSDMKAHYFAGYSNVLKNFLPGMCAFPSIEANHAMALDPNSTFGKHPYHSDDSRRNNPLADDMREAMEIITKEAKVFTLGII
ncbi:MAG: lactate racemase domain-containing protein, partial [Candidatus Thorarchaeota archaeon]